MPSCRDALVCENIRLVYYIYGRMHQTEFLILHKDDVISSGLLGLVKAAQTFDKERGAKFSTYAALCIRNEMLMYLRKIRKSRLFEISLDEPVKEDESGNILTLADTPEAKENPQDECLAGMVFEDFLREQSILDRDILRMRIAGYKQKEVAKALGYSQAYIARRIRGIKARGRKWFFSSLVRG